MKPKWTLQKDQQNPDMSARFNRKKVKTQTTKIRKESGDIILSLNK